mgnify:FL=1
MATIKDVAKKAGVSVATVSRVLNDEGIVAEQTVKRVKDAIRELDYMPNMLGNHLRKSTTNNILVLIPTASNQFYNRILRGIQSEAHRFSYNTMVCMTNADNEIEEKYLTLLKTKLADGAVFLSSTLSSTAVNQLGKNYPIVQCCEKIDGSNTSYVAIDNEQAGYDATCALIKKGHRKIAFLGSSQGFVSSRERHHGYCRALEQYHIPYQEAYVFLDTFSYSSGIRSAEAILQLQDRPTAIFAIADTIAIGAMRFLLSHSLRVPEDIAVIGFDNISVSSVYTPSLSTVAQPQLELGQKAVGLLLDKMKNINCANRNILLPHNLLLRETV